MVGSRCMADVPKLSVVIPTLNEASYLPKLLASLRAQDWQEFEIIVADSGSTDLTRAIARRWGARVVEGPRRGPAHGRNLGASVAKGELLLFLDADVVFPKSDLLRKAVHEFQERRLVAAGFFVRPLEPLLRYRLLFALGNAIFWLSQWWDPRVPGWAILTRRDAHVRVRGFDETPAFREDHIYVWRLRRMGPVRYLRTGPILVSARRFEHDGLVRTLAIYLLSELARPFGRICYEWLHYSFGHFSRSKEKPETHERDAGINQ